MSYAASASAWGLIWAALRCCRSPTRCVSTRLLRAQVEMVLTPACAGCGCGHRRQAFAHCTSIVVDGPDGTPIHFRTMDWGDADRTTLGGGMPELKAITVMIDFQRDGKTVYSATTWAGYVGVLTGMRHGGWSVSVNFRVTEDWGSLKGFLKNAWAGVTSSWPVGFLNRYVSCGWAAAERTATSNSLRLAGT